MRELERPARIPRNDQGRPLFPLSIDSLPDDSPENRRAYSSLLLEEARLINEVHVRHSKFLELTARYHGISPRPVSGPLLRISASEKNSVTWKRRYLLKTREADGRTPTPGELLEDPAFLNYQDEVVVLRESAVRYPGYAALCMYHECGHLELARAAGKPSADEIAEEVRVRHATLPFLIDAFKLEPNDWMQEILDLEGFHILMEKKRANPSLPTFLSPDNEAEIKDRVKRGISGLIGLVKENGPDSAQVKEYRTTSGLRLLVDLPPSALVYLARDWEIVQRRWAILSKESRRIARGENARSVLEKLRLGKLSPAREATRLETVERLREERPKWEREAPLREAAREAEQKRLLARQAEKRRRRDADWIYLKSLARLACSDPDAIDAQAEKAEVVPSPIDAIRLGSHIAWESRGPGSLSACQKWTLQKIEETVWRGNRATTADISAWVRVYRKEHPGAVKFIGDALGQFTKSLAELIKAFLPDPGPPTRTPSSRSEEDRSERTPEPDCGPPNSETGIVGCCVTGCR